MKQYPEFIQKLKKADPELYKNIAQNFDLSMEPGALDIKTKFLILLAVDTIAGSSGVAGISERLRAMGASEKEIKEALRIAYLVAGNKAIFTGMAAF